VFPTSFPSSPALTLTPPAKLVPPVSEPVELPYNLDAFTFRGAQQDGAFDNEGATIPAEMIGDTVVSEGIGFRVGPRENGKLNAVSCQGQTLSLPAREFNRLYLLAASAQGDTDGVFRVDDRPVTLRIQNWTGHIGQWDNRVFEGDIPEMSYSITNPLERIDAGFIKRDPLAWFCSHRHLADGGDAIYSYSQLFKYRLDFPVGEKTLTLPDNPDIRVLAVTAARDDNDTTQAAWPLYDDFTGRKPVALRSAAITTAGR
jgi:alpha-mannosidase